jgi:septal ring factor EnvC (AmiA/AmiB activator)
MSRCAKLVFLFLICCFPIFGQTSKSDLEKRKKALQDEIKQTNQLILETRKNKKASLTQLKALNAKLASRMKLIGAIQGEINQLNSTITSNSQRIGELNTDLSQLKLTYGRLVKRAYMNRNQRSALLLVFSAQSIQQAYKRLYYLKTYSSYRKKQAALLENTRNELDGKLVVLKKDLDTKQVLLGSEQVEKKELSKEKSEQEKALNELKKKEKGLKKELANKEVRKKKLDSEIRKVIEREIERERAAAAKASAKTSAASKPKPKTGTTEPKKENAKPAPELRITPETAALSGKFEANKGRLPWPVDKGVISETFGTHPHPVLKGISTYNNGIDIATSRGASVKSIFEGEVMGVVSIPGAGYAIILKHGTYLSVYGNLASVNVSKGQKIKTGAVLGKAGENDEGQPEAHLEIWQGKTKLNPTAWIAR